MDTEVLRVSQINLNLTKKWKYISTLPTILFCLLGLGNIFVIISHLTDDSSKKGVTRGGRQLATSTFHSTVIIKGAVHIFTIVFVRATIFLKREQVTQFFGEFKTLVEQWSSFSSQAALSSDKTKSVGIISTRSEGRLRVELIILCISFIILTADMWEGYLSDRAGKYLQSKKGDFPAYALRFFHTKPVSINHKFY